MRCFIMKKIVIVVPKINPLKETKEERKCRVQQAGSSMRSRVVPNKKKNVFARFFNPTLAHKILFHADIPMMTIPV